MASNKVSNSSGKRRRRSSVAVAASSIYDGRIEEESASYPRGKEIGNLVCVGLISEMAASQFENNVGELLTHYLLPMSDFAPSSCAIDLSKRERARLIHGS